MPVKQPGMVRTVLKMSYSHIKYLVESESVFKKSNNALILHKMQNYLAYWTKMTETSKKSFSFKRKRF